MRSLCLLKSVKSTNAINSRCRVRSWDASLMWCAYALLAGASIASKGIPGDGLGVQRAEPMPVASYPSGRVGGVERQRFSIYGQLLAHLVGDDRDVVVYKARLYVGELEVVERPRGRGRRKHSGERFAGNRAHALGAGHDAWVVRELHRGVDVLVL